jgi:integrase
MTRRRESYRLFKATYTDRATGQQAQAAAWYVEFRDHLNVRRRWPLSPTERVSRQWAEHLVTLVRNRHAGEAADPRAKRWAIGVPQVWEKLVAAGIVDAAAASRDEPLALHVDAFKAEIKDGRQDREEYAEIIAGRVRRTLAACGFTFWRELCQPGAAGDVRLRLGTLRASKEITGRTLNYYVRDLKRFGRWLSKRLAADLDPLADLAGVDDAEVDKKGRRALSVDELRRLIDATAKVGDSFELTAAERATLYRFAYATGIRPGQIRKLTAASFALESDPPTVTARAATVKRRRPHVQVLAPAIAAELRTLLANKVPTAAAFKMPDKFTLARMLRVDLAKARESWIEEAKGDDKEQLRRRRSDSLAHVDHAGEAVTFYSIRHSHGTHLADAGVPQKDVAASLHHTRTPPRCRWPCGRPSDGWRLGRRSATSASALR